MPHTRATRRLPSRRKARTILREGRANRRPLSKRQRGFFGLIAGGGRPTRLSAPRRNARRATRRTTRRR